ncbi:MAG: putative lipid II flippase FtsW [Jatrophihabitans sp.]
MASLRSARDRLTRARSSYLDGAYTSVQLLLLAGALLLGFGIVMAASTTISASLHNSANGGTIWSQLVKEGMFVSLGLPVLWLGLRLPPRAYRLLAYPILLIALLLLLAVLVPHVGVTINGAQRWLAIGPFQLQPSEFAKFAMLLWGADLLARKEDLKSLKRVSHVMVPLVPAFGVVILLVMLEPDLGTTLCFLIILLGLLWTVGLPMRYFAGIVASVAGAVTVLAITEPYRLERLTSFTDPFKDAQNTGHQAVQGLYALSSGGVFGVGLGSGTSKFGWVPNANSDYIFSIIGEELGLLGCLAVLASFGLLAYSAVRVARRSNDAFIRLATSGTAVWLCGQALINIGYVTGLLPVTGIPLPFVSAGGTSLVLTMGVLGMLVSFARHEPDAVRAAQRDARTKQRSRLVRWLHLGVPRMAGSRRPRPQRTQNRRPAVNRPAARPTPVRRPAPARQRQPARSLTVRTVPVARQTLRPTGTEGPRRR